MELAEKVKAFLKSIGDCICLYHFDVDGCGSASILKRKFDWEFFPYSPGANKVCLQRIRASGKEKVLIIDTIPSSDFLKNLREQPFFLDHHERSERVKLNYLTIKDYGWNVALGYFLAKIFKAPRYIAFLCSFWDKLVEPTEFWEEGIYQKRFFELLPFNLITSYTEYENSIFLFNVFNKCRKLDDALEMVKGRYDYEAMEKCFYDELKRIKMEDHGRIKVVWIKRSKFRHIRVFVDYFTFLNPSTYIFVNQKKPNYFTLSLRTCEDIDLTKPIASLSKKFRNFEGGGHKKACGARYKGTNIRLIIDKLIDAIASML